jgi:hypothetical protein
MFAADQIVEPTASYHDNYALGSLKRNIYYLCFLALFVAAIFVALRMRFERMCLTKELILVAMVVNLSNLRYLDLVKQIS